VPLSGKDGAFSKMDMSEKERDFERDRAVAKPAGPAPTIVMALEVVVSFELRL